MCEGMSDVVSDKQLLGDSLKECGLSAVAG